MRKTLGLTKYQQEKIWNTRRPGGTMSPTTAQDSRNLAHSNFTHTQNETFFMNSFVDITLQKIVGKIFVLQ